MCCGYEIPYRKGACCDIPNLIFMLFNLATMFRLATKENWLRREASAWSVRTSSRYAALRETRLSE
jgi:hypothetical protein